jgi:integrase
MTLYRPAKSPYWHYDFVIKGQRYYGTTHLADKAGARKVEAQARLDAVTPHRGKPPITLDEAAGYYAQHAETKPSWKNSERILRLLLPILGKHKLLSEISQVQLRDAVAKRRVGRADSSVNREIVIWRALWRHAAALKFDTGDAPDWGRLLLKIPRKAPRSFTHDQEAALMEALRPDLHPFAAFAFASGWRLSEITALRWSDLDLGARVARTKIKGGDVIERPLSSAMLALVASQPRVCPQVFTFEAQATRRGHKALDGRVRAARKKGERYPFSKNGWRKPWVAALAAAGIDGLRFHDARHTAAKRMTAEGISLATVGGALGHKSLATTMRYASANTTDIRAGLDAMQNNSVGMRYSVAKGHKET